MKSPLVYNGGSLRWEPENLKAYARYLLKFVQSYEAQGIRVAQLHVQNEPDSRQVFPSCLWTGEKMRDFIRDYLGPLFKKHLPNCEIWVGTVERPQYDKWAGLILDDPLARSYIAGVGYQWAGKGAVQQTLLSWPELGLMQTENECGDGTNSWDYAHYTFGQLWHYLTNGVQRYIYWNMVLPPGGNSTWGWAQNALITVDPKTQEVIYNPEYYVMRHFSQYVKAGSRRVGLEGSWNAHALAFQTPNNEIILVVHNPYQNERCLNFRAGDQLLSAKLAPSSFNTFVIGH